MVVSVHCLSTLNHYPFFNRYGIYESEDLDGMHYP